MSIQRWTVSQMNEHGWQLSGHDDGEWVAYADYVAAVAAARAEGRRQEWVNQNDEIQAHRDEGYAAGLKAARDAVAAVVVQSRWGTTSHGLIGKGEALAAIDALEKP